MNQNKQSKIVLETIMGRDYKAAEQSLKGVVEFPIEIAEIGPFIDYLDMCQKNCRSIYFPSRDKKYDYRYGLSGSMLIDDILNEQSDGQVRFVSLAGEIPPYVNLYFKDSLAQHLAFGNIDDEFEKLLESVAKEFQEGFERLGSGRVIMKNGWEKQGFFEDKHHLRQRIYLHPQVVLECNMSESQSHKKSYCATNILAVVAHLRGLIDIDRSSLSGEGGALLVQFDRKEDGKYVFKPFDKAMYEKHLAYVIDARKDSDSKYVVIKKFN